MTGNGGAASPETPNEPGVLLVIGSWDARGGLQVILRTVIEGLGATRPVTVLTWHARLRRPTRETRGRLTVIRLPLLAPWTARSVVGFANMAASIVFAVGVGIALRRRWAAALAADLSPTGVAAVLLARLLGRRAVASAWIPGPTGQVGRLRRSPIAPVLLRTLRAANGFVAQTEEVADELRELGLERVVVIASGVSLQDFAPVSADERESARTALGLGGSHLALYCGRFDLRQKRLDILLEAWRRAALPDWHLALAGDGWDRPEVDRLVAAAGDSATILPWTENVRDLYATADIFVLPTSHEGMSRALIEGMACGLPGLVSDTLGHRRMMTDGVVLVPNEVEAWTTALRELADGDERRGELGAQARAWVERHAGVERLLREYERVLFGPS